MVAKNVIGCYKEVICVYGSRLLLRKVSGWKGNLWLLRKALVAIDEGS